MTVLAKTRIVCTKTEFNFIATVYRYTQYLSIPSVSNVKWSTFPKGILPTLLGHSWNNGTHGGYQVGSGVLYLLPLTMRPTSVLLATVWASWLLMGCSKQGFLATPTPPHPATNSTHPSIINTDSGKEWQILP